MCGITLIYYIHKYMYIHDEIYIMELPLLRKYYL